MSRAPSPRVRGEGHANPFSRRVCARVLQAAMSNICRVGKGAKHRAHAVHSQIFVPRGLRSAKPTLQRNKEAERRQTQGRVRTSECGSRHDKVGLRRPVAAGALACRRSTTALAKGIASSLRLSVGPGFLGPGSQRAYARLRLSQSSEAPRTPVVVPADVMPEPPGSGLQIRPRAPHSPRPPDVPPGGVLAGELDSLKYH